MDKLYEAIKTAIEKMGKDGITGWGINCLQLYDEKFGELIEIGPTYGCANYNCNHVSHSPAAPIYKWLPPEGWSLSKLGSDDALTWYYLKSLEGEEYVIEFSDNHPYYDSIKWADFADVPEWILAELAK